MIEFPNFKYLELSDKEFIESFTSRYDPYSDYNFVSLWSWNIKNKFQYSVLNNNLVIEFSDYVTEDNFYSFIGHEKFEETANTLFEQLTAKKSAINWFKLIPEVVIKDIQSKNFQIVADRDNFDYVFDVQRLQTYAGSKLASKRNYLKQFNKNYSARTEILNLKQDVVQKNIKEIFFLWVMQKEITPAEAEHEFVALCRLLDMKDLSGIISLGVYIGNQLKAFWILEIINKEFAMSHFQKASNADFIGISQYLMQQGANLLSSHGVKFINFEQDLGIRGLREGKQGYHPISYLRKYLVKKR